jgi:hypothetical protein
VNQGRARRGPIDGTLLPHPIWAIAPRGSGDIPPGYEPDSDGSLLPKDESRFTKVQDYSPEEWRTSMQVHPATTLSGTVHSARDIRCQVTYAVIAVEVAILSNSSRLLTREYGAEVAVEVEVV